MTDWRALCEELLEAVTESDDYILREGSTVSLVARAREALAAEAEHEVVGPSEVLDWIRGIEPWATWLAPGGSLESAHFEIAQLVTDALARWGHQPAPAAEGDDVGDEARYLVKELRDQADELSPSIELFGLIHRAADLLEQRQSAPVPAAVGEAAHIRRMCDIILGSAFGNKELDSLALLVGHHPDVLNALPAPVPVTEGEMAKLALKELEQTVVLLMPVTGHKKIKRFDTIRAALKRLQELENKADLSPAPAPAEGEVAELVDLMRQIALPWEPDDWLLGNMTAGELARAADLLEQRHPAPVPVSERLPGDELCWWFEADEDCGYGSNWTLLRIRGCASGYTHWLPAHALPLPSEEVK